MIDPSKNKPALVTPQPCEAPECKEEILKGLTTKSKLYLPVIAIGPIMELPLLQTIIASLALLFDVTLAEFILFIQPLFSAYRVYKLPSRVMRIYSLLVKLYNYVINSKIIMYCTAIVLVLIIYLVFNSFNIISCDAPRA